MDALTRFRERLARFDPGTVVRVESGRAWGQLPWGVLVSVACDASDGVLAAADGLPRPASDWRGLLPAVARARVVESVPATALEQIVSAAATTLREMTGKAGERAIRDALLDHVAISGKSDVDGESFEVRQRLIQGLVRMRLAGVSNVDIVRAGPWIGLKSVVGQAWQREGGGLTVRPIINQPNGR